MRAAIPCVGKKTTELWEKQIEVWEEMLDDLLGVVEMKDVDPDVERLLEHVFARAKGRCDLQDFAKRKREFVFHMTDWHTDLDALYQLFNNPCEQDVDSACEFMIGFLYHVIPHLNAAGRLLVDEIPDPFGEWESRQK